MTDEKICVPLNMQIHARMSEKLSCLITLVDVPNCNYKELV